MQQRSRTRSREPIPTRWLLVLLACCLLLPATAFEMWSDWEPQDWYSTIVLGFGFVFLGLVLDRAEATLTERQRALQTSAANLELQEKIGCFYGRAAEIGTGQPIASSTLFLLSDARAGVFLYSYGSADQRTAFRSSLRWALDVFVGSVVDSPAATSMSTIREPLLAVASGLSGDLRQLAAENGQDAHERMEIESLASLVDEITEQIRGGMNWSPQ